MSENTALALAAEEPDPEIFDSVKQGALEVVDRAHSMAAIDNDESFRQAELFRSSINRAKKDALAKLEPSRKKSYDAYQEVLKLIREVTTPFDQALEIIDAPLGAYRREQDRLARIEEDKRKVEAKKLAEDAALNAADAAAKSGNQAKADAILAKPVAVPSVSVPKPAGTGQVKYRDLYDCDPDISMELLVEAVYKKQVPIEALMPNMTFLNIMARGLKENMNYPGVRLRKRTVAAS